MNDENGKMELSVIVRTISSILFPFITIYGLYIIMHGHLTPGGGFQGGAVVASGIAMLLVAYGSINIVKKLKEKHLSILESVGALAFIGLAFLGISTTFFYNFLAVRRSIPIFENVVPFGPNPGDINTAGTLPLMNLAVGLKVIAGLSAIILVMALAASHFEE
jgi:multicomponent Na+:H+ antiporter subunit B